MGFFKKLNKAVGLGENNDLFRVAAAVGTGGMSELAHATTDGGKSLKDTLLGKKAKDINPDDITNQMRAMQSKGLGELNSALDTPSENIVREGIERQKKGVLSSAQDARRNAQRLMAQKGMGTSSIGMNLNRSIDKDTGETIAGIDAQAPGMIRNQQIQDAQTRIGMGNINTQGMNFNKIEGQRSGGLLGIASSLAPVAGAVAGGMMGGPAGAQMGSQLGSGIGGALGQQQNPQGAYNPNRYNMGNYNF